MQVLTTRVVDDVEDGHIPLTGTLGARSAAVNARAGIEVSGAIQQLDKFDSWLFNDTTNASNSARSRQP